MKLIDVVAGYEAIERISGQVKKFRSGYMLAVLQKKLSTAYDEYQKRRLELVDKYGREPNPDNPDEKAFNGKFVPPNTEEFDKFIKDYSALVQEEVDITFKPIPPEVLFDEDIPFDQARGLLPFIKEE